MAENEIVTIVPLIQHDVFENTSKILTIESSPEIKKPTPKIVQIMTNSNMNNLSFKIIFNHQEFIENSFHYRNKYFHFTVLENEFDNNIKCKHRLKGLTVS